MTTATISQEVLDEVAALRRAGLDPDMPACPDWCTLDAGHPWDSTHDDGRQSRGHQGPSFGDHVSAGSVEYENEPGVQYVDVSIDPGVESIDEPVDARALACHIIEAAGWAEAHQ